MSVEQSLLAYLDDTLQPAERAAFEAEIAKDPRLAAHVAKQRQLAGRLSSAYDPVLEEPLPSHFVTLARAANDRGFSTRPQARWGAMAACVVVGLAAGWLAAAPQGSLVETNGAIVAHGALAKALTGQLAAQDGAVRIGLTFKSKEGRWCRTFTIPRAALAGLSCRRQGRWTSETLVAIPPEGDFAYRTAGSQAPPTILAAVDALAAGAPVDAAAERAARDRGWTP